MMYTPLFEKQASAEKTAAHDAEVSELKKSLRRAERTWLCEEAIGGEARYV